jgi:hypothetical protein
MEKLAIVRMRVGPPDRDGMLVSLSIGDPRESVSAQSISMTLRVAADFGRSAREIQAAALRRCAEILEGEVILDDDGPRDCGSNIVSLHGGPRLYPGGRANRPGT